MLPGCLLLSVYEDDKLLSPMSLLGGRASQDVVEGSWFLCRTTIKTVKVGCGHGAGVQLTLAELSAWKEGAMEAINKEDLHA